MRKSTLVYLSVIFGFFGCSKDSVEEMNEAEGNLGEEAIQQEVLTEAANFEKPGAVSKVYFGGNKIQVEDFNGDYVYQGDIVLTSDMVSKEPVKVVYEKGEVPSQKSTGRTSGMWPDNTVYYVIDGGLANQTRVIEAIQHWEEKTNLKFVKRSSQPNYISFVSGTGCSSYVGMIGGRQEITLSSRCDTGNVIHEIGHAVGLWHEQSRLDRTSYISINYNNIEGGREHNFDVYDANGMDGTEFTSSLDFQSIMMYGSYSFSGNGAPTMVKKDGSTFEAQRSRLSSGDIFGVNTMYPSNTSSTSRSQVYENGVIYYINGANVLRHRDRWYFSTRFGWKSVYQKNDYWYYL